MADGLPDGRLPPLGDLPGERAEKREERVFLVGRQAERAQLAVEERIRIPAAVIEVHDCSSVCARPCQKNDWP